MMNETACGFAMTAYSQPRSIENYQLLSVNRVP
jgi:hypothetical protein